MNEKESNAILFLDWVGREGWLKGFDDEDHMYWFKSPSSKMISFSVPVSSEKLYEMFKNK